MKTIKLSIRQLVIASFLTILILGGNVSAKGTETKFASSYENSVEQELKIEDWMINDNHWNVADESFVYLEQDKSLNLESWMMEDDYWKPSNIKNVESFDEKELKIENWMINGEFWKMRK